MIKIMIVDDDFLVRTNLRSLIETSGYCCQNQIVLTASAEDGERALYLLDSAQPDIIFTDICMPSMDGLTLQQRLKEKKYPAKIIILSGYDDIAYVRQSLKSGAVDYILKHELNQQTLEEVLSRTIEQIHTEGDSSLPPDAQYVITRDYMMKLLSGFFHSEEELRYHTEIMRIEIGLNSNLALLICVASADHDAISSYVAEFSILNVTNEILHEYKLGICCHISEENYLIILSLKIYTVKNTSRRYYLAYSLNLRAL